MHNIVQKINKMYNFHLLKDLNRY